MREAIVGAATKELCRKYGFSDGSYHVWRITEYGGMEVPDVKWLKSLEAENARLKRLLAELVMENEVAQELVKENCNRTVAGHGAVVMVRWMHTSGLSQRRALDVARMSASVVRYQSRPDRNIELRASIVGLACRYRRYGVGVVYLKRRQRGECVDYKRIERLCQLEKLQVQRRKRKKRDLPERHPLGRPSRINEIWSMDFVFGGTVSWQAPKCLTVVDNPTHEAVAVIPDHRIGGLLLRRPLDQLAIRRGLPRIIRSDNQPEFVGKGMLNLAHERYVH